jgi:hypothetical protein
MADSLRSSQWAQVARNARQALTLLGYPVPECMPDEPDAYGGSVIEHAASYFTAIVVIADHQLTHVDAPPKLTATVAADVRRKIIDGCQLSNCSVALRWPPHRY